MGKDIYIPKRKALLLELQLDRQLLENREASAAAESRQGLRADEYFLSIPRQKYKELIKWAIKGLRSDLLAG